MCQRSNQRPNRSNNPVCGLSCLPAASATLTLISSEAQCVNCLYTISWPQIPLAARGRHKGLASDPV